MRAINNIREVEEQTGKPLLPSILSGFTKQMDEKIHDISKSLESGDVDELYRTAHAIKSMSANIGAENVRSISASIEAKGRSGDISDGSNSISLLKIAYKEFVERFEEEFIR
jgi:HPt (histidine-containing phosphotransfer) domain-containing protein